MSTQAIAFQPEHNHKHCLETALRDARALCHERKQRLTPIRELVLRTIWQSHKPLGAYELLPTLSEAGFNSAPPTVYRALEFLQEQGLVHRISRLNAFIGCPSPDHPHQHAFLICEKCNNTLELETDQNSNQLKSQAQEFGFSAKEISIEITGVCSNCLQGPEA